MMSLSVRGAGHGNARRLQRLAEHVLLVVVRPLLVFGDEARPFFRPRRLALLLPLHTHVMVP